MPNSLPPNQSPDLHSIMFTLMENQGRMTQMVADTRDIVVDVRSTQMNEMQRVARLEEKVVEQRKDHDELKFNTVLHEARTTILEQKNMKRAWVIGTVVTLGSLFGSGVWWIILNWETIQRVMRYGSATQ